MARDVEHAAESGRPAPMVIMPPVGSQPSLTENSTISISPIQNVGVA